MSEPRVAPYGSWRSPITADLIVQGTVGLGQIVPDGGDVYWLEVRPAEGGRSVIVRRDANGGVFDMTPAGFNSRTRVHEYGGGDYTAADGVIYFSNFTDQRLYRQTPGSSAPVPLTPAGRDLRYADPVVDRRRRRLIAVREEHDPQMSEASNTLVGISFDGDAEGGQVLAAGADFFSSPRLSPDGSRLAWLAWNHPNMPWDGTELWVAEVNEDGTTGRAERVAGGDDESIFQPEWSPDGQLYFISDRSGWWNLYRLTDGRAEPLCPREAEFGLPQWIFGLSTYAFLSAQQIACVYLERGRAQLAALATETGELRPIETPYTEISSLRASGEGELLLRGGSPARAPAVVCLQTKTGLTEVLRRASELEIEAGYLSIPQAIEFPTADGLTAYAFYYPPRNRDDTAPPGELPPLLVKSHGGPTSAATMTLNLGIQFWTSRGFAVLDVNYGGSTGYGREYRRRLNGRWGIVDVDDCVNGARHLIERKLVDGARCAIDGGSAGGYTTLSALTFRDLFRAGASHYGVSDLEALTRETHKFESRYLDRLIGPYPEAAALYRERSPIHFTDRLACPVIFFQGLEDKVVLPNQAEMMVEALRAKGLPVAYVPFAGEQHGFRRAENIKRALEGELYFYARVFGFALADPVEPVEIENLEVRPRTDGEGG